MTAHDSDDLRRWQEEVARDPGAPCFVLLAEAFRRQGRAGVARRVCLRGLERDPENAHAHYVLGRVLREAGDQEAAIAEWNAALRFDAAHRAARRALGYLHLERREWGRAVRHLEGLAAVDGGDARLAGALDLARRRLAAETKPVRREETSRGLERIAPAIAAPLDRFSLDGRFRFVLLLDRSGRVLTQRGFPRELDVASLASLGAGIHAASAAMAALLGQPGFEQLCQGEGERQAFLGSITSPSGELLVLGAFGTESNVGLVRLAFQRLVAEVAGIAWPEIAPAVDPAALEEELAASARRALPAV